jgi:peptide/nickel transport system substrate-binding protein
MMEDLIYTPLVDVGPDLKTRLATSLAQRVVVDEGGRRYRLYLRHNVKWSDGKPVTAADVLFTIRADSNPDVTESVPSRYLLMQSVRAIDPYTVEIRLKKPSPPFLMNSLAALLPLPAHVLRRYAEASPQEAQYLNTETAFSQHPVVSGPFVIERNVTDSYTILKRNPSYWGPFHSPFRYAFRVYPQQDSLYAAVDAGEVDVTDIPPNLWRIHDRLKGPHTFVTWPWNVAFMLLPNFADPEIPFFHERAVRQAMMYAINRDFIVHGIMNGQADVLNGPVPEFSPYHDPHTVRYPYDPARASALLEAAGWHMQGGVRVKNGRPLHFVLKTGGATDAVASNIAELIQANLKSVGIDCELQNEEITTFFADLHALKFSVALRGVILTPYPDDYRSYDSKATRKNGGYNYGSYSNPQMDAILERARSAPSAAQARADLNAYQELAARELPVLFLYSNRLAAIVPSNLTGYELTPDAHAALPMGQQFWKLKPSSAARR